MAYVWFTIGLVRNKKLLDYDNDLDFGCFFDPIKQKNRKKLKPWDLKEFFLVMLTIDVFWINLFLRR